MMHITDAKKAAEDRVFEGKAAGGIRFPCGMELNWLDPYFGMLTKDGLEGFITADQLRPSFGDSVEDVFIEEQPK